MKKELALSIALALCLLAGCGGTAGRSTPAAGDSSSAAAEPAVGSWPAGTVTILCGYGAGGSSDLEIRSLTTYLEKYTGGTFVVQNITGANGWMAWDQLLRSDADGLTLAMVNTPAFFYDYLDPSQGHSETMEDFDFICNEVSDFGVLVCDPDRYADIHAFMEAAKAPGGVTVADVGANGNKHIATIEMGLNNPDATLTPVHQSGWSDNYAAVLGGTVDAASATFGDITSVLGEGNLRILCVFNSERVDAAPDVPTLEEAGYGPVYSPVARGYFMPKGVDAATKAAIAEAFEKAILDEEHAVELASLGAMLDYKAGEEYIEFLKSQESAVIALKPQLGWG